MKPLKISIITTVNHNVGDDFVREGIIYIMKKLIPDRNLDISLIHKHSPISVRHGFEWLRINGIGKRIDNYLPLNLSNDRIMEADIVIQSGAPAYWCSPLENSHCADNEWYGPLINKRFKNKNKRMLFNLAVGTCQAYYSTGEEFESCQKDQDYIKDLFSVSDVTTVRDKLAQSILKQMGLNAPLIPCSSIFAIDNLLVDAQPPEYIAINYMPGGAHYLIDQKINANNWFNNIKSFYEQIKNSENVVFVCHNESEIREAKKIDSSAKIFYSDNYIDYVHFYSKAKMGMMNRIHGAFLLASFGRPSVIIGNDSRARMASEIGLENLFVNDVTEEILFNQYHELNRRLGEYPDQIKKIKSKALEDYLNALHGKITNF